MSIWTILRNQGTHIYKVVVEKGELDITTGNSPKSYVFERILALLGTKNYGFELHTKLDESMIILEKKADIVVIGTVAYKTELKGSIQNVFIYKIDKVVGNEYQSIVGQIPPTGGDGSFLL